MVTQRVRIKYTYEDYGRTPEGFTPNISKIF